MTTTGQVVDAVSNTGLGGVTISGTSLSVQSDADGTFVITGEPGATASLLPFTFSSPSSIPRETSIKVPGSHAVVSLIGSKFDLVSFDEMFRTPELDRWITAPPLKIETRTGQFVAEENDLITTVDDRMSEAEYASIVSDLTTGLQALSGGTFPTFASITRQDSAPGEVVSVLRPGVITVMRVRGMDSAIGAVGLGSAWVLSNSTVVGGMVLLDRDFDQNSVDFAQQVRQHELGHAMGYSHVTSRDSLMNPTTGPRAVINDADELGARVAFERPPGNQTPDVDPSGFFSNPAGLGFRIKGPQREQRAGGPYR